MLIGDSAYEETLTLHSKKRAEGAKQPVVLEHSSLKGFVVIDGPSWAPCRERDKGASLPPLRVSQELSVPGSALEIVAEFSHSFCKHLLSSCGYQPLPRHARSSLGLYIDHSVPSKLQDTLFMPQ